MKSKTAILTVGRPGSGKSSSCDRIVNRRVLRANVLHVEDWFEANREHQCDRYGNSLLKWDTMELLWRHVNELLNQYRGVLLIDKWLKTTKYRQEAVTELRHLGIERIVCWHFVTPPEVCRERFIKRETRQYFFRTGSMLSEANISLLGGHWDFLNLFYEPVSPEEASSLFDDFLEIDTARSMNTHASR